MTMFNYNKGDETFNSLVDEVLELSSYCMKGEKPADYDERARNLNAAIARYAVSGTRLESQYEEKGLDMFKSPRVVRNSDVLENYNVVVAEVINAIAPTVVSETYTRFLAEVRQVGWGDTARFLVQSNEMFKVNEIAEGVTRGVLQPIYNNEFTIDCSTTEIATFIDWYSVATGVFDWGDFGFRAGRSFENYVMIKIVKAMTDATALLGDAYDAAGVDTDQWTTLADRVSAANGGATVYAIGTIAALNKVIPATIAGSQYVLGEELGREMIKDGYLGRYLGVRLIPISQAMVATKINTTADLVIPTNIIYMVASEAYRPVKIVFEGDSVTVEKIPEQTTDKTYWIRVQIKLGVGVVIGSKHGTITLN